MSQKQFKEFGLKYIEEMAKEREHSKQEVSIDILNLKESQFKDKRDLSFVDLENFVEGAREHIVRVFDGEFTKLTIKSLSKMRQLLSGSVDASVSLDDEVPKAQLDKALQEVSFYQSEADRLRTEKNKEKIEFDQLIERYKNANSELEDKISSLSLSEKKFAGQVQSLEEQLSSTKEQVSSLTKEVNLKSLTLDQLVEQNKLKEEDLQLITENMDGMLQSTEEQHRNELEDAIQRTRNEMTFEYELTIGNLQTRFDKEKEISSELETKFKKLEADHNEFVEKTLAMKKDYTELKFRLERGHKTLSFIQSLLSHHPLYSAVMILSDLGGTLPLDKLAKSVGVAPIRMRQLLSELAERGLIEIGEGENPQITIPEDY